MKARVKATGEIVELSNCSTIVDTKQRLFTVSELEDISDKTDKVLLDELDEVYWANMEHQYAGMAMQGILNNPIGFENIRARGRNIQIETALLASEFAHALVEKMKEVK